MKILLKGNMKKLLITTLLLSVVMTNSGCWDRVEINDIAIIVASSLDMGDEEGEYLMSLQIPLPGQLGAEAGGGGGTSGEKTFYVDGESASNVREATDILQKRMARRIFFAHRRVIVISEEVAREVGIRQFFDAFVRVPENRTTAFMVISQGKAQDFLNAQPELEQFSAEVLRELMAVQAFEINLKDIAQMLNQVGGDALIPYVALQNAKSPEEDTQEIEFLGFAQFKDDRLVNVLTGDLKEGAKWLIKEFHPFVSTIDVEGTPFTLQYFEGDTEIDVEYDNENINFTINIEANSFLLEDIAQVNWDNLEEIRNLKQEASKHIKQKVEKTVEQMREHNSDIAQLGLLFSRKYPRIWRERYRDNWEETLAQVDIHINVNAEVSRTGLITENIADLEE